MDPRLDALALAVHTLDVDVRTVELTRALARADVPSLVIKGPVLAQTLYADAKPSRTYADTDVLVPETGVPAARRVLGALGYVRADTDPEHLVHATTWLRPEDGGRVDLHRRLPGVASGELWDELWASRVRVRLGRHEVDAVDEAATALLLVSHVQHHVAAPKPLEDLHRGIERFDADVWRRAEALATRTDAHGVFAAGLRAHAPALADQLGLPRIAAAADVGRGPTSGLALTLRAGTPVQVFRALARRALPPPDYMRAVDDAGPHRRDLVRAHVARWVRLVRRRQDA